MKCRAAPPPFPSRPRTGDTAFDRPQAEMLRAMLESSIQVGDTASHCRTISRCEGHCGVFDVGWWAGQQGGAGRGGTSGQAPLSAAASVRSRGRAFLRGSVAARPPHQLVASKPRSRAAAARLPPHACPPAACTAPCAADCSSTASLYRSAAFPRASRCTCTRSTASAAWRPSPEC
jgi:hypothetical protein